MEVIGYSHDCFNMDVILSEFQRLGTKSNLDDNDGEHEYGGSKTNPDEMADELAARARHYLVFFFQSWDGGSTPLKLCCARYGLLSIEASFVHNTVMNIISSLSQ
jgi:hypothetical protein